MARKPTPKLDTADIEANSIDHLATSLEAVAARLRAAIGKHDAWRVLGWAADEADRLAVDARDIGDESRVSEAEANR